MSLTRKDIMLLTNKETAFKEIGMKTEWDNHRKAAERSSWRKKHEPDKIKKCPNRGRRRKNGSNDPNPPPKPPPQPTTTTTPSVIIDETPSKVPIQEEEDELCFHCHKPSEGYDFPCSHPICHPCFIRLFEENEGHMVCHVCHAEYDFQDNILEDEVIY